MTDSKKIIKCITSDGKTAYRRARMAGGAYTLRGNSIVRVDCAGSVHIVKGIGQVKVRVRQQDKEIVIG